MLDAGDALNNQMKKSIVWYRLYTAPSPQSFRLPPGSPPASVNMFTRKVLEIEKNIIGNVDISTIQLSAEQGPIDHTDDVESPFSQQIYSTSINNPIVVVYPQDNYVKRDDLSVVFPAASRLRRLEKSHSDLFSVPSKDIDILKLRIDILAFLKTFNNQARDIWK